MTERLRESLSALMDDSANELELERVLKNVDDEELRGTWVRYHAARSAIAGQPVQHLELDISQRVRAAIAEETEVAAPQSFVQQMIKPVASFAVAASVAAVVVVGGLQVGGGDDPTATPQVAATAGVTPVGMATQAGAVPVRATFGTQALPVERPDVRAAYRDLARQQMQQLLPQHVEHAALNTPQGLVPYARVEKTAP